MENLNNFYWILVLYLLAIFLWFAIVYFLNIQFYDLFDIFIFLIPIFSFFIALANLNKPLSPENEKFIFLQNYSSSFSVILMPILIYLADKDFDETFLLTILLSTGFGMLAFLDFWTSDETFDIAKHLKSIFQTISIGLILFGLKFFFRDSIDRKRRRQVPQQGKDFEGEGILVGEILL